jgi:aldehyde dehydrogenase (NAD+)
MYTPLCATRLVETLEEAGLPPGVLNMVHGSGDEVGERLVVHPGIDAVSFTGSCAVGEHLAQICSTHGKTLAAEMGGKNPIIVMDDADLDLALEGVIWGGFGTAGQRCTAASRVIVHEAVYATFRDRLVSTTAKLKLGDGLLPETHVGPLVNAEQMERVLHYVEVGKQEGAKLLLGGYQYTEGGCAHGYFIAPTIFSDVDPAMRIAQEEIFGPVVALIPAKDLGHAIEIANGTEFGLSSAIYSRDVNKTAIAERDLDFGLVYINASTIGAEIQLPFGGTKRSGMGHREAGGRGGAIDLFSKVKVIYRDFSGKLQRAQIDKN